jgi:membrane-associated phospholipid phosphatase
MANLMNQKVLKPVTGLFAPSHPGANRAVLMGAAVLVAALAFAVLAFIAHTTLVFNFDIPVTLAVQQFNPGWFDVLMRMVNWMGFGLQAVALVSSVVVILFLVGWRWEALVCAVDAAGIWVLNLLIAMVVNRPYPTPGEFGQVFSDLTRPSFPSGHVTSYIGIYGFVWFLVYTRAKQPWLRIPLLILLGALVLLVSPSRIYMGRHWPSDVLASVLLGGIWLALTLSMYLWSKQRFFAKHA